MTNNKQYDNGSFDDVGSAPDAESAQDFPVTDGARSSVDEIFRRIVLQIELDLAGKQPDDIAAALRQRFHESGISVDDPTIVRQARRISGAEDSGGDLS